MQNASKQELDKAIKYCRKKLRIIGIKTDLRNFIYAIIGVICCIPIYIIIYIFFPILLTRRKLMLLIALGGISIVYLLRPKDYPLAREQKKYLSFEFQLLNLLDDYE